MGGPAPASERAQPVEARRSERRRGAPDAWLRRLALLAFAATIVLLGTSPALGAEPPVVRVGSKSFTESYLLAEMVAQVIDDVGEARAERKLGLGGTGITFRAIAHGDIDLYPEYTGTIAHVILKDPALGSLEAIRRRLEAHGLTASDPLGFANTYALAVRREAGQRLGLRTISDLALHPGLTGAFSSGFLERSDGWPGLRRHYGLALADVRVIEHALAYQAIASGTVDVIDVFSTDGRLARADLRVLRDDRRFFPDYSAVLLVRRDFVERFPRTWARLGEALSGRLSDRTMAELNAHAAVDGQPIPRVAEAFLGRSPRAPGGRSALAHELLRLTVDHLFLVAVSLVVAVALGLPLGILAARFQRLGQVELASVGMLQTIPALALLTFMIPMFGIGTVPSLVALSLYALLPIVRNAYTGLVSVDRQLLEVAGVLGLDGWQRLRRIELPLASVSIMAGVKTSAVLTVGTATLAAFIGGGGYGTLIVRGLALDDIRTILAGAVPAALMALAMHGVFELADRLLIPRGLRKEIGRTL